MGLRMFDHIQIARARLHLRIGGACQRKTACTSKSVKACCALVIARSRSPDVSGTVRITDRATYDWKSRHNSHCTRIFNIRMTRL